MGRRGSRTGSIRIRSNLSNLSNPMYVRDTKSLAPQAVCKVTSHLRGSSVRKCMNYIARAGEMQQRELESAEGDLILTQDLKGAGYVTIDEIYKEWRMGFERKEPGSKRDPRHATHMILSAKCEHTLKNQIKVLAAARETLQLYLKNRGYTYVMGMHQDGTCPHVHIVINNYHTKGGPKLRLNPPELLDIRRGFATELSRLGVEHVATLRKDRAPLIERVTAGVDRLKKRETQFQRQMRRASPSVDAFEHRMQLAKAVARMREEVRKEAAPMTFKRRESLAVLRGFERSLTKQKIDPAKEIKATLNRLGKDSERFKTFVAKAKAGNKEWHKSQRRQRKESLGEIYKRLSERIARAERAILESKAAVYVKSEALKALREHEKHIRAAIRKGPEFADMTRRERKDLCKAIGASCKEIIQGQEPTGRLIALDKARERVTLQTKPLSVERCEAWEITDKTEKAFAKSRPASVDLARPSLEAVAVRPMARPFLPAELEAGRLSPDYERVFPAAQMEPRTTRSLAEIERDEREQAKKKPMTVEDVVQHIQKDASLIIERHDVLKQQIKQGGISHQEQFRAKRFIERQQGEVFRRIENAHRSIRTSIRSPEAKKALSGQLQHAEKTLGRECSLRELQ